HHQKGTRVVSSGSIYDRGMLIPFVAALAVALAPGSAAPDAMDADLRARFEISAAPGAQFVALRGDGKSAMPAPRAVQAPSCPWLSAGLCDINWASAPPAFAPLPLPLWWQEAVRAGRARVLLRSEEGTPLVLLGSGTPAEVLLAVDLDADAIAKP